MDMTSREILDALGGYRAVADHLQQGHQTVHNWMRRGIPAKHWPALTRHAATIQSASHVTIEVFERHQPEQDAA
jgi:hypothetical protein